MKTNIGILYMLVLAVMACTPERFKDSLGNPPQASFEVQPLDGAINTFVLSSTSTDAFNFKWEVEGNGVVQGAARDTVYFPVKGAYSAKLIALGPGGYDVFEQSIEVTQDDPSGCVNLLYGCQGSKTWVLAPEAGALMVGDLGGAVWWSNSVEEVAVRSCTFNDEYTFTSAGDFIFDNKGDMRVEDEAGAAWPVDIGLSIDCHDMSEIPAKYQAWGSGEHRYALGTGTLKVIGEGAFMGLYKVGDAGTSPAPEASISFDIVELTADRLVINKKYDWGQWTFTFVPKP